MSTTGSERVAVGSIPTESVERLPGPDVVRALALVGVVVMNYHGYLILRGAEPGAGWTTEVFDPWTGPLATRFAATFVLVAGVGVTLLTRGVVAARTSDPAAVTEMRWRLVRRGLFLYALGLLLDEIWPGTIIPYYGAMFVLAAGMFTLRSRWILAIGAGAAAAAAALQVWIFEQRENEESTTWLTSPAEDSVQRYAFDVFVNGTHPLLPWCVFFCVGIVLGRVLMTRWWRPAALAAGFVLYSTAVMISSTATTRFELLTLSTDPFDRGLIYVASALGTALIAFAAISWIADRLVATHRAVVDPFRRAGQMTLTIYVAHILVFNFVVDWIDAVEPAGVGTALAFAFAFWAAAIVFATLWNRRFGRGPLERVYRAVGG